MYVFQICARIRANKSTIVHTQLFENLMESNDEIQRKKIKEKGDSFRSCNIRNAVRDRQMDTRKEIGKIRKMKIYNFKTYFKIFFLFVLF